MRSATVARFILAECTVSGNSDHDGAGLYEAANATATIDNTIVAGNAGGGDDIDGAGSASGRFNLIGTEGKNYFFRSTDTNNLINQVSDLASLGDYGGPTETMDLLAGSPAINARSNSISGFPATDLAGFIRPNGGDDIGAVQDQVELFPASSNQSSLTPAPVVAVPYEFVHNGSGSFENDLGAFSDNAADTSSPYTVTINWGDGPTNITYSLPAQGSLDPTAESHAYSAHGTYVITVCVSDANHDESQFTIATTVNPAKVTADQLKSTSSTQPPYTFGNAVNLTETFVGPTGSTTAPTGSVTFYYESLAPWPTGLGYGGNGVTTPGSGWPSTHNRNRHGFSSDGPTRGDVLHRGPVHEQRR